MGTTSLAGPSSLPPACGALDLMIGQSATKVAHEQERNPVIPILARAAPKEAPGSFEPGASFAAFFTHTLLGRELVGTLSPIDPATANPARRSGTLGMAGKRLGAAAGGRGVRATPWSTGLEGRWQVEIRGILRVIQSPPGGRRVQDGEGPRIFRLNCLMRVRSGGTHP